MATEDDFDLDSFLEEEESSYSDSVDDDKVGGGDRAASMVNETKQQFKDSVTTDLGTTVSNLVDLSLPSHILKTKEEGEGLLNELIDENSQSLTAVRREASTSIRELEKLVPEKGILNSVLQGLRGFVDTDETDSDGSYGSNEQRPDYANEATRKSMEYFGEIKEAEDKRATLKETLTKRLTLKSNELNARQLIELEELNRFTGFTDKYYRKSLETQFYTASLEKRKLELLESSFTGFTTQLDKVIHNTGLPNEVKLQKNETFGHELTKTGFGKLQEDYIFNSGWMANLKQGMNDKYKDFEEKFYTMNDMAGSGNDFITGIPGMAVLAAKEKIGGAINKRLYRTEAGKKFYGESNEFQLDPKEYLEKKSADMETVKEKDTLLSKGLNKLGGFAKLGKEEGNFVSDLLTAGSEKAENTVGDKTKRAKALELVSSLFSSGGVNGKEIKIGKMGSPDEIATYDNRAKLASTVVVPDLLSKILSNVEAIRKGVTDTTDRSVVNNELAYDYISNGMVKKVDGVRDLTKTINKSMKDSSVVNDLHSSVTDMLNSSKTRLSKQETSELLKNLTTLAIDNTAPDANDLLKNDFIRMFKKKTVADKVKSIVNDYLATSNQFTNVQHSDTMTEALRKANSTILNPKAILNEYKKSNRLEVIKKAGIVDVNEFGEETVNNEKYRDIIKRSTIKTLKDREFHYNYEEPTEGDDKDFLDKAIDFGKDKFGKVNKVTKEELDKRGLDRDYLEEAKENMRDDLKNKKEDLLSKGSHWINNAKSSLDIGSSKQFVGNQYENVNDSHNIVNQTNRGTLTLPSYVSIGKPKVYTVDPDKVKKTTPKQSTVDKLKEEGEKLKDIGKSKINTYKDKIALAIPKPLKEKYENAKADLYINLPTEVTDILDKDETLKEQVLEHYLNKKKDGKVPKKLIKVIDKLTELKLDKKLESSIKTAKEEVSSLGDKIDVEKLKGTKEGLIDEAHRNFDAVKKGDLRVPVDTAKKIIFAGFEKTNEKISKLTGAIVKETEEGRKDNKTVEAIHELTGIVKSDSNDRKKKEKKETFNSWFSKDKKQETVVQKDKKQPMSTKAKIGLGMGLMFLPTALHAISDGMEKAGISLDGLVTTAKAILTAIVVKKGIDGIRRANEWRKDSGRKLKKNYGKTKKGLGRVRQSLKGTKGKIGGIVKSVGGFLSSEKVSKQASKVATGSRVVKALKGTGNVAGKLVGSYAKTAKNTISTAKALGTGAKFIGKKIPIASAVIGAGLAASSIYDGQYVDAGLELASGLVATIPWVGTAASIGLDGYIWKRRSDREDKENADSVEKDIMLNKISAVSPWLVKQIGKPYLEGSNPDNTDSFDNSSLIVAFYRTLGIKLPSIAESILDSSIVKRVSLNSLQGGDLLFFGKEDSNLHAAIYIGDNWFVDARGKKDGVVLSKFGTDTITKSDVFACGRVNKNFSLKHEEVKHKLPSSLQTSTGPNNFVLDSTSKVHNLTGSTTEKYFTEVTADTPVSNRKAKYNSTTKSTSIPVEARALLDTIASTESPGYNVIYGGSTFSGYSKHPKKYIKIKSGPNKGKFSSAAGRYQFIYPTWKALEDKFDLPDFSPESQDLAAWELAKQDYHTRTKRNLETDIKNSSNLPYIGKSLHSTWTSLPGGIEAGTSTSRFSKAFNGFLSKHKTAITPTEVPSKKQTDLQEVVDSTNKVSKGPVHEKSFSDTHRPAKTNPLTDITKPPVRDKPIQVSIPEHIKLDDTYLKDISSTLKSSLKVQREIYDVLTELKNLKNNNVKEQPMQPQPIQQTEPTKPMNLPINMKRTIYAD